MKSGTKIVSSIYELNYIKNRTGEVYKNLPLLISTIKNIIFPEYEYVIYTDEHTYSKHHLKNLFNHPNVTFKFKELNTNKFINLINDIRKKELSNGMNYDRIYCVDNYMEVILNKLEFLLIESIDCENIFWVDAGLIGTSCHDGWRDYMVNVINSKNFLDKTTEKINEYGFIHLKGNNIQMNYELRTKFTEMFNCELKVVPGCLFGGKSNIVKEVLTGYDILFENFVKTYDCLISEQEVLTALTNNKKELCHPFEFNDWLDLQKGLLKVVDLYDKDKYITEKCYVHN
jgi:hypothetical protein